MITSAKISVIVPIHRIKSAYLDSCLNSLITQTLKDFESILILNDSTDNERSICEEICNKDTRFKLFETANADVSTARNIGLDNAQGKYITFLDCDDWFSEDALEKLFNLMEQSMSEIGIANTKKVWNNKTQILFHFHDHTEDALLKKIPNVGICGFVLKNEILKTNRIRFKEGLKLSEDRVFFFEYYFYCKKISFTNDVVYFYRQHNSSVCKAKQTHEHAIQQLKAASYLNDILKQSSEFSTKDIAHLDRILTRMGMAAYINSGTTRHGVQQLKNFFLKNISKSRFIFYYCWYRAKISAFIGNHLHL